MAVPASLDDMDMTAKLSISREGITGYRVAIVDYDEWWTAVTGLFSNVGTIGGLISLISGTAAWPGLPFLQVDTVDAELYGQSVPSDWDTGPIATKVKLTINYKTRENGEDEENDDQPEDEVLLIQSLDYNVDIITVPVKITSTQNVSAHTPKGDTAAAPVEREIKKFIRLPTITYVATIPEVAKPNWAQINAKVGKVNTDIIFKGAAGTVLFDGPHAERELKALAAKKSWKLTLKMIYQRQGWNKVLHPDTLDWVDADALNGANKPYETTTLKPLLTNP